MCQRYLIVTIKPGRHRALHAVPSFSINANPECLVTTARASLSLSRKSACAAPAERAAMAPDYKAPRIALRRVID